MKEVSLTVQLPETLIKALRKEGKKQGKSMKELIGTSLLTTYADLLNIPQEDNNSMAVKEDEKSKWNGFLIEKIFKMKRIFIILIVAMLSFSVNAQDLTIQKYKKIIKTDVTTFLDIPVDGTVYSMKQKLMAKGFKQTTDNILSGQFNGKDVYLNIAEYKGKVWRIVLTKKTPYSKEQIKSQFNSLIRQFKNSTKYANAAEDNPTIDDGEDIEYEMSIHNKNYEANFYQKSNLKGDTIKLKEQFKLSCMKEKSDLKVEDIEKLWNFTVGCVKIIGQFQKSVWVRIYRSPYNTYSIFLYYDNDYNAPNGEDL